MKPPHDAWYKTYRWQKLRERHLAGDPLCVMCRKEGRTTIAKICDHREAHRGDPVKFWDAENLQSLCKPHHDSDKQRIEKGGKPKVSIGLDGWPE
jgi:5-methylcytosine-specific restriction protein A